ncbi:MAG: argininosuccinate synthase [Gammaproteobacteria bacterium]|nr:argininosuccinate synthase [Gammaproteobacteria bacterium]MXW44785.1 argininosuccinate synthase [Gammaproteobacteria bacterium]MYD01011.1 argininosuccinate synthase [Gammaproteobacteria bacterium]MYI23981.1 argininosuccinate synthase [Gammaproteobacteria bacterium]
MSTSSIVLAYSGGLDTSFCVPWLTEKYRRPVVTLTVNTGGIDSGQAESLERRALALGARRHLLVEARPQFFDEVIRHLIAGNVRRGHTYPLCVGAERSVQAKILARTAQELGSDTVAHGCTAAGNDQFRFEMAMRALAPEITVLAPVRDESFQRREQVAYLAERGAPQLPQGGDYSINRGLWGVTIGGRETLTSAGSIPETAWVLSAGALEDPLPREPHELEFEAGLPVAWDGEAMQPVELIETLETAGGRFGIGRGIHLGDTILGSKGRVAYEAPAAEILLCAHRELEKLTLGAGQMRVKDTLAAVYGDLVHEGRQLDPVCRDIEAFFDCSQARVSGRVHLALQPGAVWVRGVESPHSLLAASRGVYGEKAGEWSPRDALGAARVMSLPGMLHSRVGEMAKGGGGDA